MMRLRKIIEYSLYLLLFLLPFQTRLVLKKGELSGGYWEYGTYSLYAIEILLGLIVLLSIFYFLKNFSKTKNLLLVFKKRRNEILFFLFLVTILLIIFSTISAINPLLSFYYLYKFITGGALIVLLYLFTNFYKTSFSFLLGSVLQAIVGIWQFIFQTSFSSKWLGIALQDSSVLGTSVIETADGRWLRAYGGLPHPNIFAGFLVVAIIITMVLYVQKKNIHKYSNVLILIFFTLLTTALFSAFSRAAWISLIFCFLVFFFINLQNKIVFKKLLNLSLICFFIFLIFSLIYLPLSRTRIGGTNRLEAKSTDERIEYFKESWEIIKLHPILGVGLGNYTLSAHNEVSSGRESFYYQPVHNIYLLIVSELGIIITSLIALFLIIWKKRRGILKISTVILSPILILGLFDHYLISLYSGIILTSFIFALCLLSSRSKSIG